MTATSRCCAYVSSTAHCSPSRSTPSPWTTYRAVLDRRRNWTAPWQRSRVYADDGNGIADPWDTVLSDGLSFTSGVLTTGALGLNDDGRDPLPPAARGRCRLDLCGRPRHTRDQRDRRSVIPFRHAGNGKRRLPAGHRRRARDRRHGESPGAGVRLGRQLGDHDADGQPGVLFRPERQRLSDRRADRTAVAEPGNGDLRSHRASRPLCRRRRSHLRRRHGRRRLAG